MRWAQEEEGKVKSRAKVGAEMWVEASGGSQRQDLQIPVSRRKQNLG